MKRVFLYLILIFIIKTPTIVNGEQNWSVSLIPSELMTKANVVIRNYETTFTISAEGGVEENVEIAKTILNENGKDFSLLVEFYDKFSSIYNISGAVYDKNGKKIRKIPYNEIYDISAISGFSIYEDSRVKFVNPKVGNYPYTVVYSFKRKYKSFLTLPGFFIYPDYNVSVQETTYKIILEQGAKINFKGNEKFSLKPITTSEEDGKTSFTWNVSNQKAIEQEPLSESFLDFTPFLQVAPEKFEMEEYEGFNTSWEEFGSWIFKLNKGKEELPQSTKEKIIALTANKSDLEKAKILYEYLQNKVRYVSIQVGIGGFQPFPAETVDRLSYGDCKALTNYMKSLLNAVGVKSYYCLVRAGNNTSNIDKNFVGSQFNHAFLMIPNGKDTLYLECTNQQLPFGYNGTFTDDRDILVIDSTNSYIKHTNIYNKEQNKTLRSFIFHIDNQLDCNVSQKTNYIGVATENIRYLMNEKPEKQREIILNRFQLRQVKISSLNFVEEKNIIPIITESIEYNVPQIAQMSSNNSAIIPFNQVTRLTDLKKVNERRSNIVIRRSEIQIDSLIFDIPITYQIDKLPVAGSFSSIFGSYKLDIVKQENKILFVRTLEWNKGVFKPEQYSELLQYQRKVNEMDRQVIIIKAFKLNYLN